MEHLPQFNWPVTLLSGIIVPTVIGMIWYNPKVMGTVWAKSAGLSEKDTEGFSMAKAIILNTIASIFIAITMNLIVIHQFSIGSILAGPEDAKALADPNSPLSASVADFMSQHGHKFRTFRHGVLHGVMTAIFFVGPILAYGTIWERKGFKYWAINVGYWAITLGLMGGIICQWT